MALYGSTIPTDHGEFVVTILCPNAYAQQKLMQACAAIVPSAGVPVPIAGTNVRDSGTVNPQVEAAKINPSVNFATDDGHGNTAAEPSLAEQAAAQMREVDATRDDDEGLPYAVPPSCSTGGCGDE